MPTIFKSSARETSRNALLAKEAEAEKAADTADTADTAETIATNESTSPVEPVVTPAAPVEDAPPTDNEPSPEVQQTTFSEDVVIGQPRIAARRPKPGTEVASTKLPTYVPLAAALGVAMVLVLLTGIYMRRSGMTPEITMPTPTPSTQEAAELSVLQRELVLLEKDVEAADPLQAKLAFPPVNFDLKLDDATVLQQQSNRR